MAVRNPDHTQVPAMLAAELLHARTPEQVARILFANAPALATASCRLCWSVHWPEAPRLIEDEYTALDAAVVGSLLISLISHADRVYAELFLTPSSDPWLGLVPSDTYTALRDGGLTQ